MPFQSDFLEAYKRGHEPTVQYNILRTVEMNTLLSLGCLLVAVTAQVTYIYFRRRNSFLRELQGPELTSLLLGEFLNLYPSVPIPLCNTTGNEGDLRYQNEVGDSEFKWMRKYGTAWRRCGPLGVSFFEGYMKPHYLTPECTRR
jgi:hypothetical protein